MKKTLIIIGGVVAVIVVGLLIAPALIPVETYKTELLAQIEKSTGRKARIDGEFGFSLLPRVEFTAGKVSLANAAGGKAPNMVSLDKLDVRVAVFPLLSGTVVIDSFVLEKPQINLEVDSQGRPNWQFAAQTQPGASRPAPSEPAPAGKDGGGGMGLSGLQLGDVRLVDGRISYSDARSGAAYVADAINMRLSLPDLSSPMKADGSVMWNKEKIALVLGIANPNAFLDGKSTAFDATVSGNPLKLTFKGDASSGTAVKAQGQLDLDVPSVRKLAAWAGQPLTAPGTGLEPLKISGKVSVDGQKYAFTQAKLALDKIEASGDFRYDGSRKKPYVNARLDAGMLDLNPYLPPEAPAAKGGAGAGQQPAGGGKPAAEGWSDEPIDLSALKQADADLDLAIAGLAVRKIKVGKSQVKVALKDGRLVTDLTEMALYNGNGKAKLSADAASSVPGIGASFDLAGLQAHPALSDAIDLDRVEGTLNANMQIAARGKSQRELVSALDGDGKVTFLNGAIRGINIGAMVRNVTSAFLDPKAREQQKTDFAELSGTFNIKSGTLRNDDLSLLSPLLRVAGKGTVDLPKQTVDYRIEPKVVASTVGQGGKTDLGGVAVPVIVSGPWSNLSYKPDLSGAIRGVVQDPSKAVQELQRVLPGGKAPDAGAGGGSAAPSPTDSLKKLFGR